MDTKENRCWSTGNPHRMHTVPLHDAKVGVWCALSLEEFYPTLSVLYIIQLELIMRVMYCKRTSILHPMM
jgi:hypothetical protein